MAWSETRQAQGGYLHPKKVQRILAQHGHVCHVCHHAGATEVDHVVPWAEWMRRDLSVHDQTNLAPIHGQPCPTCGAECHPIKTKAESARGRARAQAKREALGRRPTEKHPGAL